MKISFVCLLLLSSMLHTADKKPIYLKLPADGAESFAKTLGSKLAKSAIRAISKACSKENTLKEAAANIKFEKERLEVAEREERLNLIKSLSKLDKKDRESGLSEKEIARRDHIKLCISVLMQKRGN